MEADRHIPDNFFESDVRVCGNVGVVLGDRIAYAGEAVQVIYDFCRSLSIPVMVYGHSTHNRLNKSGSGYEEVVDIFAYADFDSADGNDALRMMDMKARDTNP